MHRDLKGIQAQQVQQVQQVQQDRKAQLAQAQLLLAEQYHMELHLIHMHHFKIIATKVGIVHFIHLVI